MIHKLFVLEGSLHYVQSVPYAAILENFLFFSMISYCRIQSPACPISKIYDDAVFADRFHYQLTMFGISELIGLSRLIHTHITCEIDTAKITAAIFRISYRLHDMIRLTLIVSHVQITKCTMMRFSQIDSNMN